MTYHTVERENQLKNDKHNAELKEAELYIHADSFEEFLLKRTINGIDHSFLSDMFKHYYHLNDKYRWMKKVLFSDLDLVLAFPIGFISAFLAIFISMRFLIVPSICLLSLIPLSRIATNYKKARKLLGEIYGNIDLSENSNNFLSTTYNQITTTISSLSC